MRWPADGATTLQTMDHLAVTSEPVVKTRPVADMAMRRLLGIRESQTHGDGPGVRWAFGTSLLVSATRCLLSYIVLPFLAPVVGLVTVSPVLGIGLCFIGLAANIVAVRRFWSVDHPWRWPYTAICSVVVMMLFVLLVRDVISVFG
jgi:hypothetical protein